MSGFSKEFYDLISEFNNIKIPPKFKEFAEEFQIHNQFQLETLYLKIIEHMARAELDQSKIVNNNQREDAYANLNINPEWTYLEIMDGKYLPKSGSISYPDNMLKQQDLGISFEDLQPPPKIKPKQVQIIKRIGDIAIVWEPPTDWDWNSYRTYGVIDSTIQNIGDVKRARVIRRGIDSSNNNEIPHDEIIETVEVACNYIPYYYRVTDRTFLKDGEIIESLKFKFNKGEWSNKLKSENATISSPFNKPIHYICQFNEN